MSDENLGRAVLALTTDDKDLDKGLAEGERKSAAWVRTVGGTLAKGVAVSAAAAGAAIGAVGIAAGKLAIDALPIQGVADAFAGITGNADAALAKLREGSLGMVRDIDLMKSYNQAAQLVSKSFADQLPEAMQYLSKVSAATGEDMGYMIDSLVRGVGRLSPNILDNLQVQVQLSDATARASEMFGKEADELTKAEQQAGMMNVVMEKLAENTASMPEVAGTAAQQWAAFNTTLQNAKDTLGRDLIPLMAPLLQPLGALAERVLPLVGEAMRVVAGLANDHLVPAMTWLTETIDKVAEVITWTLEQGGDLEMVLRNVLSVLLEQLGLTEEQMDGVFEVINKVQDAFLAVTGFIEENATPILAALAAMLLAVVVPAFVTWAGAAITAATATVTALAPVVLPILAIGAAVALLVKAWEKDWGGIRTALTAFWEESGEPVFNAVREWLMVNLPVAIEWIKATIDAALKAIRAWWEENGDALLAKGQATWDAIMGAIDAALAWIQGAIETVTAVIQAIWARYGDDILTVAQTTWDSIQTVIETVTGVIQAVIAAVQAAIAGDWYAFGENLRVAWDTLWEGITTVLSNTLDNLLTIGGIALDALVLVFTTAWDAIKTAVSTVLENLQTSFAEIDWGELGKGIIQGVANGISGAAGIIADAARRAARRAFEAAKGFLGISSPSKLFAGLGENMMEGVAVGIRNTAMRPTVATVQALERTVQQTTNSTTFQIANYAPRAETRLELRHLITALEMGHA